MLEITESLLNYTRHAMRNALLPLLTPCLLPSLLLPSESLSMYALHHRRPFTSSGPFADRTNSVEDCSHPPPRASLVQVFDNAFSPTACEELHCLAMEHHERTSDGSSFFTRPPNNDRSLTPIENAIDSALLEMGDTTQRVEYWSRDEYMNIDTHADIDEAFLEDEGEVRCPQVGHVWYLQVEDNLRGPTCVFPDEQAGWGRKDDEKGVNPEKDLVVVPAVQGRILRFPGNAMHAVPKPPNRWLLSRSDEPELRRKENHVDKDLDEDFSERSVLLFNTWPDDKPGPRGVNGDVATGALPDGIELSEDDKGAFLEAQNAMILAQWEEDFGKNAEYIRCNSFKDWTNVEVQDVDLKESSVGSSNVSTGTVNVSLMGKKNRRCYPKKTVTLRGQTQHIQKALFQDTIVSKVCLANDTGAARER